MKLQSLKKILFDLLKFKCCCSELCITYMPEFRRNTVDCLEPRQVDS